MKLTRRSLLQGLVAVPTLARIANARGLLTDRAVDDVVQAGLDAAKKAGASYADVRIVRRRWESVSTREDHVSGVSASESYGVGVRVIVGGAWGFSASATVTPAEATRAAKLAAEIAKANAAIVKRPVVLAPETPHVDVWQTPLVRDPFKIPLEDKAELLLAINAAALKQKGVKYVSSYFSGAGEWKLLATSEGAYVEQEIVRVAPGYSVTAVDTTKGEFVSRGHEIAPMQAGWEYVADSTMLADAPRIAAEAVEKLNAAPVVPGKKDLILTPSHLWLTIHESIGHPTELDRALGYEANFAGTSFCTVDKLNKLDFAAPHIDVFADKTTAGGLATCGYDDEGVATQKWDIIKGGRFVGYQTTREQAGWINEPRSRGTSYGESFASFPFQRMPNVSLAPGKKELSLADLVSATDDGILIAGNGSWSIDHQRYNFQFGGQTFHEIKKGKITRMLKDVAYQANTVAFWHACDLLGGPKTWEWGGSMSDGKGEPTQSNAVSHGCVPARFRKIDVLNTDTRKA
jgi:TldD protein